MSNPVLRSRRRGGERLLRSRERERLARRGRGGHCARASLAVVLLLKHRRSRRSTGALGRAHRLRSLSLDFDRCLDDLSLSCGAGGRLEANPMGLMLRLTINTGCNYVRHFSQRFWQAIMHATRKSGARLPLPIPIPIPIPVPRPRPVLGRTFFAPILVACITPAIVVAPAPLLAILPVSTLPLPLRWRRMRVFHGPRVAVQVVVRGGVRAFYFSRPAWRLRALPALPSCTLQARGTCGPQC